MFPFDMEGSSCVFSYIHFIQTGSCKHPLTKTLREKKDRPAFRFISAPKLFNAENNQIGKAF